MQKRFFCFVLCYLCVLLALPSYMIPFLVKEAVANAKRGAAHQQSKKQHENHQQQEEKDALLWGIEGEVGAVSIKRKPPTL